MDKRSTKNTNCQTYFEGLTMSLDFSQDTFEINSLQSNEMDIAKTLYTPTCGM